MYFLQNRTIYGIDFHQFLCSRFLNYLIIIGHFLHIDDCVPLYFFLFYHVFIVQLGKTNIQKNNVFKNIIHLR